MDFTQPEDWRPTISRDHLLLRGRVLASIRAYFAKRGVTEVETPQLSSGASTEPSLHSFQTQLKFVGSSETTPLFLHTSPEFPMKRLLANGSGPIYQICKVFRNGETGRLHNPEFTLLEWYRPAMGYHELMREVEDLLTVVLQDLVETQRAEYVSYRDLFLRFANIDPFVATTQELRACAEAGGCTVVATELEEPRDMWLDVLLTHVIEPVLPENLLFVYDYPASQAALARVRQEDVAVAERFELYWKGIELANGFQELNDAHEQRRRIENELQRRDQGSIDPVPIDERFLAALESGLPECSGVALGIDRLIMVATGTQSIQEVMSFPVQNA